MQKKKCLIIYAITFLLFGSLIVISISLSKKQKYKSHDDFIIATYIDGEFSNNLPSKDDPYLFEKMECSNGANLTWDNDNWGFSIENDIKNTKCVLYFKFKKVFEYDYTGTEETYTVYKDGLYKIETWGAQGGTKDTYIGGYGGYSVGQISLNNSDKLYINVGGAGGSNSTQDNAGGYNGGGYSGSYNGSYSFGGGGATHIAKTSGLLSTLENNKDEIIIVSGGGGGAASATTSPGGSGGGYNGVDGITSVSQWNSSTYIPVGATQNGPGYAYGGSTRQGKFGSGITSPSGAWGGGGGGGYYGGGTGYGTTGSGGSGYIGNSLLSSKAMYCYNCTQSNEEDTKTITTTCNEERPTENCAKKGNGYARITYLGNVNVEYYIDNIKTDKVPNYNTYNFNKIDCQNGSNLTWDNDKWEFVINDYQENDTCKIYFSSKTTIELAYTGSEEKIVIPKTGFYKLETWGAAGGSASSSLLGGSGSYSAGVISLSKNDVLYINIGGGGNCSTGLSALGGYNGGGAAISRSSSYTMCSGGGATSITKSSGLLSSFSSTIDKILMVAGGGGGSSKYSNNSSSGGSGGGINGAVPTNACTDCGTRTGGSQTAGGIGRGSTGAFGQGGGSTSSATNGGGGGYYGGGGDSYEWGATGGSGYIGNSLLKNKSMYCYNCTESSEESTKTVTTTCNEETPTEKCAKKGNGYARITYIANINLEYYINNTKQESVPDKDSYVFDSISCENGSNITWNDQSWSIDIKDYQENDTCKINFRNSKVLDIISTVDTSDKCPNVNADGSVSVTELESTNSYLCSAPDSYGTSYYYRGNVTNNYVKFGKWSANTPDVVYGFKNFDYPAYEEYSSIEACQNASNYNYNCTLASRAGKDMYWRIIRINGDKSVRLIYDGTSPHVNSERNPDRQIGFSKINSNYNDNAYIGYMYGSAGASTYAATHTNTNNSTIKTYLDNWYKTNLVNYSKYISDNIFCNDRSITKSTDSEVYTNEGYGKYLTGYRWSDMPLNTLLLTCPQQNDAFTVNDKVNGNGALTYPIGLLTADEAYLAGAYRSENKSYYLHNGYEYWTMTPFDTVTTKPIADVRYVSYDGYTLDYGVDGTMGVRPIINLKAKALKYGDGTSSNPYRLSIQ